MKGVDNESLNLVWLEHHSKVNAIDYDVVLLRSDMEEVILKHRIQEKRQQQLIRNGHWLACTYPER